MCDIQTYNPECIDGDFNLEEFYWKIVRTLDDKKSRDRVIKFWNKYVFFTSRSSKLNFEPQGSIWFRIRTFRRADQQPACV